jgi:hypothetical protein
MGFAAAHPDLVRGLVMSNTFAWKPEGKALVRMLRIMSSRPITALDWTTRTCSPTPSGIGGRGRSTRVDPGSWRATIRVARHDRFERDDAYRQIAEPVPTISGS